MTTPHDPWANPLARGPLANRDDVQRAVRDLYEPLRRHTSDGGAQVQLGSFGAVFEARVAGLEGFARPLYGIVPLTVGGGSFEQWDRIARGLVAGTDPASPDYWGPVVADVDQRMVEQAAIGLALAFCPEKVWEPLSAAERDRLVEWLSGIYRFEPAPNNWHFFRILVSLGLERVGAEIDVERLAHSLDSIDTYRTSDAWYVDGAMGTVDYYVPFALHTYGLMYAAANDLGLGDDTRAEAYRERSAAFAQDFQHWFAADGASIAMGRSLTYRFAMSSFWGAMAWANVESSVPWGLAKGLSMRHLRWWADKAVSDRDGVLSVGFAYDNRKLCEGYNSAGSPYWAMKAFGGLAAPADHPFWASDEEPLAPLPEPVTIEAARWVVTRNDEHAVALGERDLTRRPVPRGVGGEVSQVRLLVGLRSVSRRPRYPRLLAHRFDAGLDRHRRESSSPLVQRRRRGGRRHGLEYLDPVVRCSCRHGVLGGRWRMAWSPASPHNRAGAEVGRVRFLCRIHAGGFRHRPRGHSPLRCRGRKPRLHRQHTVRGLVDRGSPAARNSSPANRSGASRASTVRSCTRTPPCRCCSATTGRDVTISPASSTGRPAVRRPPTHRRSHWPWSRC